MSETTKHLELIQGIISRMAQVSFIIKGWTLTLVAGLLALAVNANCSSYAFLALLPAMLFWVLDAYYLRQERLFRSLYDEVRLGPSQSGVPILSMDTKKYRRNTPSWPRTMIAPTIFFFHGAVIALAVIVAMVV